MPDVRSSSDNPSSDRVGAGRDGGGITEGITTGAGGGDGNTGFDVVRSLCESRLMLRKFEKNPDMRLARD